MADLDSLPNFFILGAAKAGTTTLYNTLNQHPQVYFPVVKEPAFFCDDSYFEHGLDWYSKTYYEAGVGQPARGEATARYLYWGEKVAGRIQSVYKSTPPRFLIIFREPSSLVHSFYWNSVREGHEELSLADALGMESARLAQAKDELEAGGWIRYAYSRIGLYAQQVRRYLAIFPKERFLFLLTEDLKDHPALMYKLESFLELDHLSPELIAPIASNTAALPRFRWVHRWLRNRSVIKDALKIFMPDNLRHRAKLSALEMNLMDFQYPAMAPDIRLQLCKHYRSEIIELESIIHRDLSAWYKV